ncbi:DUF1298 domain-containing protein [Microbacterium trichothecenolyticum]|uniref:wax ester/triacylglycerol synthase domain-containing protein n=1 Tax=Microbacterium trichothecenolyticum TaxID=69370 RepID=UPI001C6F241C|nr:wax ester/triacylglycerol synthase domain-containing protein [Microbacterium trichothecenolyticum]MBW9120809.1 DUF1298 domain-containing protein [Microbacterium trichothecenolyticum]
MADNRRTTQIVESTGQSVAPKLRPVDEANLVLDRPGQVNVFLAAGLLSPGGFVGPRGDVDMIALRSHLVPKISQLPALRQVPVGGRRHHWVPREPDLDHHVRLESPLAESELERRCGRLMTERLPWDRPLWELLIARRRDDDGAAFIVRIHHAIADGIAAADIVCRLLDSSPTAGHALPSGHPATVPDDPRPSSPLTHAASATRRTVATLVARGIRETVLLGLRSAHHGVSFVDVDLADVAAHARGRGASVNDSLLAAAAGGYRAALIAAGEEVPPELPVSVPVALPRRNEANAVGVMLVRLPLREPLDERLERIAAQTRTAKIAARAQGTLELMRGPWGARLMNGLAQRQHLVGGFVTNVPGPVCPLNLGGAAVTHVWPVAVLAANVRVGIAAVSYAGRLSCGIHVDSDFIDCTAVAEALDRDLRLLSQ